MEGVATTAPMSCLDSHVAAEPATNWTLTTKVVSVSQDALVENVKFKFIHFLTDINECEIPTVCDEVCVNTNGSFHCLCTSNTILDADGQSCIREKHYTH